MILSSVTITVELLAKGWGSDPEPCPPLGRLIRLVEVEKDSERGFNLIDGTRPAYPLSAEECGELLSLLEQMTVKVPWDPIAGFDGCTYCLMLKGAMSAAEFRWWVDVPKGWESIGAVSDYVIGLADRISALSPDGEGVPF